jgi:hypothetical protein
VNSRLPVDKHLFVHASHTRFLTDASPGHLPLKAVLLAPPGPGRAFIPAVHTPYYYYDYTS